MKSTSATKKRRLLLWGALGIALAAAVTLLVMAKGKEEDSAKHYYVRILNERGQPVPTARCSVHKDTKTWEWDRKSSVLLLPTGQKHSVIVHARGYRIRRVAGIDRDGSIELERGIPVAFDIEGNAELPAGERVVLLQIRPVFQRDPNENPAVRAAFDDLVKLLDVRSPDLGKHLELPREGWGYPVTIDAAKKGVLFPDPGEYTVHWGLLDKSAGTWFTLDDEAQVSFEVAETVDPQRVILTIDKEAMQATRRGLRRRIEEIEQREADDAQRRADGALPSAE